MEKTPTGTEQGRRMMSEPSIRVGDRVRRTRGRRMHEVGTVLSITSGIWDYRRRVTYDRALVDFVHHPGYYGGGAKVHIRVDALRLATQP